MSIRFILPASNVQHIFTSYLLEGQIILVEELIFGQMLAEAVQCSVLQDHIVQQTHKKFLVPAGITAAWALQLKHVGISVILFLFYNCYEQVITLRERRYARSREVAVKSVKENAQAQADGSLQRMQLKRELLKCPTRFHVEMLSNLRGATSGRMEIESGHPPLQDNDEYSNSLEGANAETENEDKKKSETRSRPTIEIAFRDLMVTLKQKKKHLLRSVTGEIRPGRITALMGPSGAGKTTLLSALAGKSWVLDSWFNTNKWKSGVDPIV
ncbi:UNVERIFIED_CONTAM: ABC transporter G family member 24 [Sesamum calycinum]|uniref:ABC transporter G family member 24 n=1 Tax=Sesamum calycinum TaxID=2727403 RepID=A0AAW2KG16_9LAMI